MALISLDRFAADMRVCYLVVTHKFYHDANQIIAVVITVHLHLCAIETQALHQPVNIEKVRCTKTYLC